MTKPTLLTFAPGPTPNTVRATDGKLLTAPAGWVLLPPGDAALTRRVKVVGHKWCGLIPYLYQSSGPTPFSKG